MKWIGLTGGIASGKSTVTKMVQDLGFKVLNADTIAHQALLKGEAGYFDVVQTFGPGILADSSDEIDRAKLAQMVFHDPKKLLLLEAIIHPLVQKYVHQQKEVFIADGEKMALYDVPLLFEKKLESQFDAIILVYCSEQVQIERMQKRNGWSLQECQKRLANQISIDSKISRVDYIIYNQGTIDELKEKVAILVSKI